MRSGVMPVALSSASLSCAWVVEAGWMIKDLASPTLASKEKMLSLVISALPAASPPVKPIVKIAPTPFGKSRTAKS